MYPRNATLASRLAAMLLAAGGILNLVAHADTEEPGRMADLAQFLDKSTPTAQRQAIFTAWNDSALKGDPDAQYIVGSLYRRGDDIVPHVVEHDTDQARRYLSTAAAHGRVLAMAKMAELELSADRPQDAMIWAQIFGYYRGWAGKAENASAPTHDQRQPTMYFEDLLRRASERLRQKVGDQQTALVEQQVNAFIAAHDADVRLQLWQLGIAPSWTGPQSKLVNAKNFHTVGVPIGIRDMVSEWVLDFGTDGSVKHALPFDALPNFLEANTYHGLVSQYAIEDAGNAAADRYALRTVELRKGDRFDAPTRTH
jgi:hypothetical protein